jgi:murein DD-endopeptidase MepM/ murein hydrolase activator NlpD
MPLPPTPYPVAHIEFEGQAVLASDIRSLDLLTNVSWQADALTMVLDNARRLSDFIRKEQPVEVWLGYARDPYLWDKSELAHVFSGAVDGVLPNWGADTTLTVSCRDHTRELIDSQADPGWSYMSLADAGIVTLLAERAGLTPKVSPSMVPISEQEVTSFLGTPQGANPGEPFVGASGWDIVQTLAVRNGFVAYVTVDKLLYWGPRNDAAGVPIIGGILAAAASLGTWTYLEEPFDLLGVTFDDSALVVNKVTVVRWLGLDQVQPDGFVSGFAVDAGRLQAARGRVIEKTVASTTATSVQDCEAEAAALLKKLARPAITAVATLEGDPRLVGDAKITLAGTALGRFAADYYIEAAKHHFGTDGYTCELQLTSVRPEASEAYRSALNVGQGEDQALVPDANSNPPSPQQGPLGPFYPVVTAGDESFAPIAWTNSGTHAVPGHPEAGAMDIFALIGAAIYAPVDGTIVYASTSDPLGGNNAVLQGADGQWYYFAHGNEPFAGGAVKGGQRIGKVGQTGQGGGPAHQPEGSRGSGGWAPHCHFASLRGERADSRGDGPGLVGCTGGHPCGRLARSAVGQRGGHRGARERRQPGVRERHGRLRALPDQPGDMEGRDVRLPGPAARHCR